MEQKPRPKPPNAGKGRPKGVPNKATADIKALAQTYSAEAMQTLFRIAMTSESDQARVSAIKELFDRGYGKAKQSIDADVTAELIGKIKWSE